VQLGDSDTEFTVHALGRPMLYALACQLSGSEEVHKYVGIEPSGEGHHNLALNQAHKPHNALINTGAMVCASMINTGDTLANRFQVIAANRWILGNCVLHAVCA
jgi:glutaminase